MISKELYAKLNNYERNWFKVYWGSLIGYNDATLKCEIIRYASTYKPPDHNVFSYNLAKKLGWI
jgi:hypothetical protein